MRSISGQFFIIQIMESANGKPAKVLHQQSVKVKYPSEINGFVDYELTNTQTIKDTSFVGGKLVVKENNEYQYLNLESKYLLSKKFCAKKEVTKEIIAAANSKPSSEAPRLY